MSADERVEQGATAALAAFTSGLRFDDLPGAVTTRLAQCLLDFVAVALAGRLLAESSPALIRATQASRSDSAPATAIGLRGRYPCRDAAFLNGAFAHSLDFDDTNIASGLHPGAPVIAAALAVAEREDADSATLLSAIAAGYEACCRVGKALGRGAYNRGFHPTAIAGLFGAVAAGARLAGLSPEATTSAFGLAGSMAAGSMQYLDNGSWNKRLHAGLAAQNAVMAIELTGAGVMGASAAIEGTSGLLVGYTDTPDPAALTCRLGGEWLLASTGIKPYPACRLTHGAIDAAVALRRHLGGDLPDDAHYELTISPEASVIVGGTLDAKLRPQNSVDAQFSVYFQTAVALCVGHVEWASYEMLGTRDIENLIERIHLKVDPNMSAAGAELTCMVDERKVDSVLIRQPSGEPGDDLPWGAIMSKFERLALQALDPGAAAHVVELVRTIDEGWPTRSLTTLLSENPSSSDSTRIPM